MPESVVKMFVTATHAKCNVPLAIKYGCVALFSDNRDASVFEMPLPSSQAELPARSMSHSYTEAVIPIGSDLKLREKYVNFHNNVRFGRILEDLDTMAGWLPCTIKTEIL